MNKFLVIIIGFLFCTACESDTKTNHKSSKKASNYNLIIKDSLAMPINNKDYYFSYFTHVTKIKDSTYLIRDNYFNNSIDIYNWNTKQKTKNYTYKYEGPNGIKSFGGAAIYPISLNSFFILTINGRLYITKETSVVYQTKPQLEKSKEFIRSYGLNAHSPVLSNNKIFFYIPADYLISQDKLYLKRPLIASFDLNTKKIHRCSISVPKVYDKPCWDPTQGGMSFTKNNKKELIALFSVLNKLYIYNIKKDSVINKITFKSKYVNEIKPMSKCDYGNNDKFNRYLKNTAIYKNIVYDKYKDAYYIFVMLPLKKEKIQDGNPNFAEVMPFSIIVLDKNYQKLTEQKFNPKTFQIMDYFVTEEGLWISNNNPKNPNFNEDELSFSLFKLEKK